MSRWKQPLQKGTQEALTAAVPSRAQGDQVGTGAGERANQRCDLAQYRQGACCCASCRRH